jgi:hypothetical protein
MWLVVDWGLVAIKSFIQRWTYIHQRKFSNQALQRNSLGPGSLVLTSTAEARNAVPFPPQHEASFIGARAAEVGGFIGHRYLIGGT